MTPLLLLAGCGEMPRQDWAQLQEIRQELARSDAARFVPDEFERFDTEYSDVRREFARLDARFSIFRDPTELARRLRADISRGEALIDKSAQVRAELARAQEDELDTLSEGVGSWSGRTWDPAVRRTISRLELAVRQAREAWRQGRYDQVSVLLDAAREDTEKVQSHFLDIQARYRDPDVRRRWAGWFDETVRWTRSHSSYALVIDKYHARAILFHKGSRKREYPVELGWNWLLDKKSAGDGATPEGKYRITRKKGRGATKYFLALLLDYPNAEDRREFIAAKRSGEIGTGIGIGGLIEIHGEGGRGSNWTQGCVALDNDAMKELYQRAYVGMPVTIVGKLSGPTLGD